MALFLLYWFVLAGSAVGVMWIGDRTERAGLFIIAGGSVLTTALWLLWPTHYRTTEWTTFAVDILVLAAFARLALKSERFWPIWTTSFQLVSVVTHVAMWSVPHIVPRAYALAQGFWAYPMLLLILVAMVARRRRIKRLTAMRY